jgi:hypothetical protein
LSKQPDEEETETYATALAAYNAAFTIWKIVKPQALLLSVLLHTCNIIFDHLPM